MDNLRYALGSKYSEKELLQIAYKTYSHFALVLLEFIRLPGQNHEILKSKLRITGKEHFDSAHAKGKGVVFASGHIGCWELAVAAITAHGHEASVYARPVHNKAVNKWINSIRMSHQVQVIGKRFSLRDIINELKKGRVVGFLFDQDAGDNGIFIDFLGRPASTYKGPAFCAIKAGCPILGGFVFHGEGETYDVFVHPAIEPDTSKPIDQEMRRIIEELSKILESYVYKYPEQYFWFHRRWKSSPKTESKK